MFLGSLPIITYMNSHNVMVWILSVLNVMLKPMPESTEASAKCCNYAHYKSTTSAIPGGTSMMPDAGQNPPATTVR